MQKILFLKYVSFLKSQIGEYEQRLGETERIFVKSIDLP